MTGSDKSGKNWRTILSLVIGVLGVIYLLSQASALGFLWLVQVIDPQAETSQIVSLGLLAWASILPAILLLPIIFQNYYQIREQPIPSWLDTQRPIFMKITRWLIPVWPLLVFGGWLIADSPRASMFLLGPVNLLVAGLPILWIYSAAQQNLDGGPQLRKWHLFGFSLTIIPMSVIAVEVLAALFLAGIAGVWYSYQTSISPGFEQTLNNIINQISLAGDDLDTVIQILKPNLLQPAVTYWALIIFAGIIPMIEELLKPLALWSLAGKKISPQEGFVGGMICGAGFALMENILYFTTAVLSADWLYMAISRAGTGVLHMLASGLVGWGLAKAWRDRNWLFSGLTLLGAFLLHGLWNALALVTGIAPLFFMEPDLTVGQVLFFNLPMIVLLLLSAGGMLTINRHFQRQTTSSSNNDEDFNCEQSNIPLG